MHRLIAIWTIVMLLAGCASAVKAPGAHDAYTQTTRPQTATAYQRGRLDAYRSLRADPAFHVTSDELEPCRNEVSSLPKTGSISDIQFWRARERNMWLIRECRDNAGSKRQVIFRMLDRVRNP